MSPFTFQGNMESSNRTLYTASSFARKSLLHLQEIGCLHATEAHTSRRDHLSSYLFFMVESGAGSLTYKNVTYPLSTGDCVFIDCRTPYAHSTGEDLWQLRWVHFQGYSMEDIYQKYKERGGTPVFHPLDIMQYSFILNSLEELLPTESHIKDMRIHEKLSGLLVALMEDSWKPDSKKLLSSKRQNLQLIREYLDTHYQEHLLLDDLAEKFFINKFYLTRIFKEQYDITINAYIQQVRITHAKQMLRFTTLPIDKIGAECGLNDANYFSRIFRKVEGMTPGEYRKVW